LSPAASTNFIMETYQIILIIVGAVLVIAYLFLGVFMACMMYYTMAHNREKVTVGDYLKVILFIPALILFSVLFPTKYNKL